MFATVGALITGAAYECAEDAKGLSANPVQDCLRPVLNQMTAFICSVGISTMGELASEAVGNAAVLAAAEDDADLWYKGVDFDRFKRELISEARTAGFYSPETQYAHIKSKYMDEATRTNTFQNLRRSSSGEGGLDRLDGTGDPPSSTSAPLASSTSSSHSHGHHHAGRRRASVSADPALCRTTAPTPQRPSKGGSPHAGGASAGATARAPSSRGPKKRGHKRSVSFDLDYNSGTPFAQLATRAVSGRT